jgi:N-acetylglucosaminyl-diphospho-decaprenol L-rhamnosyltransferase
MAATCIKTILAKAGLDQQREYWDCMTAEKPNTRLIVDVAFITVNYNTRGLLEELVQFFRNTPLDFSWSLTVVDNASTDGSLEYLDTCPDVLTVKNSENVGYGRAMNIGIAATESRYLCLLNTDVILNRAALEALVSHCDSHPDVHVCSPVIKYLDGRIQGFFFKFGLITLYLDFFKMLWNKNFKNRLISSVNPVRVDGIAGAFIFCHRKLAQKGRLFDEDFFFYYEDTELAHRLLKQGAICEILPQQSIIHIGGQSSSIRHIRLFYTGRYLYISKQYGNLHAKILLNLDSIKVSLKSIFYALAGLFTASEKIQFKQQSYKHVSQVLVEIKEQSVFQRKP